MKTEGLVETSLPSVGSVLLWALILAGTVPARGEEANPKTALGGLCPVSYLLSGMAVKGDPAHQSTYAGELYYLADADTKKAFDADPEKYIPQFGGRCATVLGGSYGRRKQGDPENSPNQQRNFTYQL